MPAFFQNKVEFSNTNICSRTSVCQTAVTRPARFQKTRECQDLSTESLLCASSADVDEIGGFQQSSISPIVGCRWIFCHPEVHSGKIVSDVTYKLVAYLRSVIAEKNRIIAGLEQRLGHERELGSSTLMRREEELQIRTDDLLHRVQQLEIENAGLKEQVAAYLVVEQQNLSLREALNEAKVPKLFLSLFVFSDGRSVASS